jgi:hypothetical protein
MLEKLPIELLRIILNYTVSNKDFINIISCNSRLRVFRHTPLPYYCSYVEYTHYKLAGYIPDKVSFRKRPIEKYAEEKHPFYSEIKCLGCALNETIINNRRHLCNLVELYFYGGIIDLSILPITIKTLKFGTHFHGSLNGLERLINLSNLCISSNDYDKPLVKLPPGLNKLFIHNYDNVMQKDNVITNLGTGTEPMTYPPRLQYLRFIQDTPLVRPLPNIRGYNARHLITDINTLPDTIEVMTVRVAVGVKKLPPLLRNGLIYTLEPKKLVNLVNEHTHLSRLVIINEYSTKADELPICKKYSVKVECKTDVSYTILRLCP